MPEGTRQPQGGWRQPMLRGGIMVDSTRGALRVRSWPKPRPGPRHPTNEYWSRWLKAVTLIYRYQPAKIQWQLQKATAGTVWMPRDIFISAFRGRAWLIQDENGRTYFPMAFINEVSESLDAIAQLEGQMIYRSSGLWAPVEAGNDGDILTYNAADDKPEWKPRAFNTLYFVPLSIARTTLVSENINSTTYVTPSNWRVVFPGASFEPTQFRFRIRGNSNAIGQTIDATIVELSAPTVPIAGTPGVATLNSGLATRDTGWQDLTSTLNTDTTLVTAFKGSNSTVDVQFTDLYFWLR